VSFYPQKVVLDIEVILGWLIYWRMPE